MNTLALAIQEAINVDPRPWADSLPLPEDRGWFTLWPGEHYAFLAGLARVVRPDLTIDIGTYHGASALALSGSSGRVITYDVVSLAHIGNAYVQLTNDHPHVEQVVGDLAAPQFFASQLSLLQAAEIVLVDGPKDGVFEYVVVPKLITVIKPGSLLILDDIRFANMQELWMSPSKPRIDVGGFAHSSGTRVVFI